MASLSRVRVALTGFPGGPGVCTFYCLDPSLFVPDLQVLWANLSTMMPLDVQINIEDSGDVIESTTGALTGQWVGTPTPAIPATGVGRYAAPVGLCVTWLTNTLVDGKRLRGRNFVVPLTTGQFTEQGQLDPGALSNLAPVRATFVGNSAGNFSIWHRPRVARAATATRPAVTARVGAAGFVTDSRISPKAAVLRSRRD